MSDGAPLHPPHALGRAGEDIAAGWLRRRGWRVLARNVRHGRHEIDLVVRRGRTLAFVEVKTRADGDRFGPPHGQISRSQRRAIHAVARRFLATRRPPGIREVRFDAVSVRVTETPGPGPPRATVEHVPDAWRP